MKVFYRDSLLKVLWWLASCVGGRSKSYTCNSKKPLTKNQIYYNSTSWYPNKYEHVPPILRISKQSLPSILIQQNFLFSCFHHIFNLKKHEDLETLPIFCKKKQVFSAKDLHVQGHAVNSSQMLHLYFWYPRSYTKLQGGVQKFFFEDDSYDFQTEISWIFG